MRIASDAPRTILGAGLMVALQGLTGLVFAVVLVVSGSSTPGNNVYGEAAYFAVLAAGVLAAGIGLLLGKHWARSPSIVMQILLLGVAWYAAGPSGRPEFGVPFGLLVLGTLVLLFHPRSSAWAQGDSGAGD
ncbi:PROBABLE CONSERVED INTEGRAL MEMBRANE PROTEIN [Alloactinosynnema sp. L-07]|uniref:hypothetical protein n=1 Tax=Alloactinosynnema sp. L-07 TaxID=1653480 RepID=UPI00065F0B1C|nr:hypothetical protein [Alloactinosynnema sp. L-07]CRK59679.1 PROBABLE CONSERVED INTEGRAL MEMBRANE PROTEIN [Alloactinosynnema sp. L-07]